MGDILSIIAIAVLVVLAVVSVRRQRAATAGEDAELEARVGADGAQQERAAAIRAEVQSGAAGLGPAARERAGLESLRCGAIAQLGERPVCIRKVAGSNPAGSIYIGSGDVAVVLDASLIRGQALHR